MTIRDRGFWVYLLSILIVGAGLSLAIFLSLYRPAFELRNPFVVLDTNYWSLSLQWPRGDVSVWFTVNQMEWRIWSPRQFRGAMGVKPILVF